MGAFQLSKWYMDCASESGDLVIVYAARLKWRAITLHYASVLVHGRGAEARVRTSMRASAEPTLAGDTIEWASEALAVSGTWTALAKGEPETIFASEDGEVSWHCHQPRARAEVTLGDRVVRGLGYAEHLELTVEPWRMPIDSLRWGRFVGERSSLVWIDWRGAHSKKLVLLDGKSLEHPEIGEREVSGEGVRLVIDEGTTLRRGAIGKTALEIVPALDRFPVRILAVDEHKWLSRGALEDEHGRDEGAVVHEIVRWPEQASSERASQSVLGKLLYALLFVAVLPAALVAWARATQGLVTLPTPQVPVAGSAIAALGATLVLAGWVALWRLGGGLPMNAFPPPRLVTRGVYALVAHPIYVGFAAVCFGVSIATGSASGLWLVSPAVVLGAIALVLGYEAHDLDARFGPDRGAPLFALAPNDDAAPSFARRLAAIALVVLPWLALAAPSARLVDLGAIALAILAPLLTRTHRALRSAMLRSLLAMPLLMPLPLFFPSLTPALIAAVALAVAPSWPVRALALVVAAPDLVRAGPASAIVTLGSVALAARADLVWRALRSVSERIANSWRETRIGRVRIINHGFWALLASGGGILMIGTLTGPGNSPTIVLGAAGGLIGAGAWAQYIEGSAALSRPYGFYGGLLGICLGALAGHWLGTPIWLLLGAVSVAGPYIQAMGRVRCLVQGCCHGSETSAAIGIRFHHPRSRVVRLAHLDDVPIHPTQLYSILWNVVTFVIVARLWSVHAPLHFIGGLYLVLNGLGRFVEEAFRGEPQTPIIAKLRLYQWVALVQVIVGAIITAVAKSPPAPTPQPNLAAVVIASIFGLIYGAALGVDFPESNRRLSRLA